MAKDSSARRESSSVLEVLVAGADWLDLFPGASGMGVASLGSRVVARGTEGVSKAWPRDGVHFWMLFADSKSLLMECVIVAWRKGV